MPRNFNQEFDGDDDQFQSSVALAAHSPDESINGGGVRADGSTVSAATTTIASSHKRKRNLPGHPDPDAEVVSLSPRTLMATNRYVCEVCHKGFQRDQNLQLHRRGHNLPWKLKSRPNNNNGSQGQVKKRVYVCPEPNCVHHDPSRALGDLTGIKKHYCRKHGEKKWKCDKCSKRYAVQSDWKAHSKICGTREYRCDCGTIFSRKDSFVTHRAFCDALTEENRNLSANATGSRMLQNQSLSFPNYLNTNTNINSHENFDNNPHGMMKMTPSYNLDSSPNNNSPPLATASAFTSATALLQKAAEMGARISDNTILLKGFTGYNNSPIVMNNNNINVNLSRTVGSGLYVGTLEVPFEKVMGMNSEDSNNNVTQVLMGGNEKLTVDFLGVATGDNNNNNQASYNERKRRYNGDNMVELDYLKLHEEQEYRHHHSMHELQSEW